MTTTGDADDVGSRWVLVALIAAGVCYLGWTFEAWGWPAIDGYPTIERLLNPGFLRADFYTNTSPVYGVDTVQAYFFGAIQRFTGIPYAVALAGLNVVRCLTFPAVVYALFRSLGGTRRVALCGTMLGALSVYSMPRTLGWAWMWGDASTAMFAVPAITLGWASMLRRRAWVTMLWFSFAAAMHPLTAVHGMIVLGLIFVVDYSGSERVDALRSPANIATGLVFSAVFIAQYIALRVSPAHQLPIADYVNILARERHPGDFLPSLFTVDRWLSFACAALAVVILLVRLAPFIGRRRLVIGVLTTYVLICVGGYVFVEVWPIRFWVELMAFRTANISAPFMLYVLAVFADRLLRDRRFLAYGVAAGASVLVAPLVGRAHVPHPEYIGAGASAVLLAVVIWGTSKAATAPGLLNRAFIPLLDGRRAFATGALGLVVFGMAGMRLRATSFTIPTPSNQHPLYAWMRSHTDPMAVFLVDQFSHDGGGLAAINPQKVRLVGHRAVVASLDFPFLDSDIAPWYDRWKKVLAGRTPDRFDLAGLDTLLAIRHEFPFQYVIRHTPLADDPRITLDTTFLPAYGARRVLVYHFNDP